MQVALPLVRAVRPLAAGARLPRTDDPPLFAQAPSEATVAFGGDEDRRSLRSLLTRIATDKA
jgi:hypothetical protein